MSKAAKSTMHYREDWKKIVKQFKVKDAYYGKKKKLTLEEKVKLIKYYI